MGSKVKESYTSDTRRGSGSAGVNESSSSSHLCCSKDTSCSVLCCQSSVSFSSGRRSHNQPPVPDTCAHGESGAKSLIELLNESEVTSDDENCLTPDEIQSFVESNKSFYRTRDQYRQHLKDRFTKYCRSSVCTGEWPSATSVN